MDLGHFIRVWYLSAYGVRFVRGMRDEVVVAPL